MFRYEEFGYRMSIRQKPSPTIGRVSFIDVTHTYRCDDRLLSTCSTLLTCARWKCEIRQMAIIWDTRYAAQNISSLRTRL